MALFARAQLKRRLSPVSKNTFGGLATEPASRKFGMDRGTPIDRYYIGKYINDNKELIRGVCLEIGDNRYTKKYKTNVVKSDVLDVVVSNKMANIIADLRNAKSVKSSTYDCIILTQVLGMIDDCDSAIAECYRMLKPGGSLIITSSSVSPEIDYELSLWRFTVKSMEYLLMKKFSKVTVQGFGNAYVGQAMWLGMVQEDIDKKYLDRYDKQFQCLIGAIAIK